MNYPELASRFAEYVGGYRSPDGSLSDAFLCKYQHTFDVVRFAGEISAREAFPSEISFSAASVRCFMTSPVLSS